MLLGLHFSGMVGLIGLKSKGNSMLTSAALQNGQSTSGISIYVLKAFKCFSFLIFTLEVWGNKIVHQPEIVFLYFSVHWNKYVIKNPSQSPFSIYVFKLRDLLKCKHTFAYSMNWNNGLGINLLVNSIIDNKSVYCILLPESHCYYFSNHVQI